MAFDFRVLPRCGAKARSNQSQPCRQAAMPNGRCYWHGGEVKIKHGLYTKQSKAQKQATGKILKEFRKSLYELSATLWH